VVSVGMTYKPSFTTISQESIILVCIRIRGQTDTETQVQAHRELSNRNLQREFCSFRATKNK